MNRLHLALARQRDADHAAARLSLDLETRQFLLRVLQLGLHRLRLLHHSHNVDHGGLQQSEIVVAERIGVGDIVVAGGRRRGRGDVGRARVDDLARRESVRESCARPGASATPLRRSERRAAAFSRKVGALAPAAIVTIQRSPVHSARRRDSAWTIADEAPSTSENSIRPGSKRASRTSPSSA